MLCWYALYVNVKHEKKVVLRLNQLGIEAYTPIVKKQQQWSDRVKTVEFPLLSGYVFVKINSNEKDKILNCPGVFSFIKFNGVEAQVKDAEIAILKSIEEIGYDVTQDVGEFKILDSVEIVQGHLKGIAGTVIQINNANYVQIQLNSIKQNIKVKLPVHLLKPISSTI
jgi:transcription antitermination factor NusG